MLVIFVKFIVATTVAVNNYPYHQPSQRVIASFQLVSIAYFFRAKVENPQFGEKEETCDKTMVAF